MNKKTKKCLEDLINKNLLYNENDLTANQQTNYIFNYLVNKYSYLLSHDKDEAVLDSDFNKGKLLNKLILKYGKYFLRNPQVIENRYELIKDDYEIFQNSDRQSFKKEALIPEEPVIFIANHSFKDDVLSTIIASKRRSYIVFGSLPILFGTFDGLLSIKNGVVAVNRKVSASKKSSIDKSKKVLQNNLSLIIFPEGVWNKNPNKLLLDLWEGFYDIALKDDGTFYPIVPIVHYIENTYKKGKDNIIHTIIDEPIYLNEMKKEEAILYIKERMETWLFKLMEKYGKTTREELLNGFNSSKDYFEDELINRIKTAYRYDKEIELKADKRDINNNPINIWENLANIEITKENAKEVTHAKKLVKKIRENDFQRRF